MAQSCSRRPRGRGKPMFQRVSRHATPPNFTATPFAYTLFALLPSNYTQASLLYLSLQIVLFIAAVIIVGVVYGYPAFPLVCLSLLLMLSSGPLNSDLRLGNLGCVQFIILAIVLALADRLRDARPSGILGGIVLSGVTLLVLIKPNVALVLVFLVLHLWVARGTRFLVMAAWPAALCGGAAVILSSLYFGSWTVWQEWYDAVLGLTRLGHRPGAGGHLREATTPRRFSWAPGSTSARGRPPVSSPPRSPRPRWPWSAVPSWPMPARARPLSAGFSRARWAIRASRWRSGLPSPSLSLSSFGSTTTSSP